MKYLFIDSNIWLSLYHFTSDDLEQFIKLKDLLGKDIQLVVPQQVQYEVRRNREKKLGDALKSFDIKQIQFPVFCKDYEEYDHFRREFYGIQNEFDKWKTRIEQDITTENLQADKTIKDIFGTVEILSCEKYINKAHDRYRMGNPPGKDNKYGDAINWECLLDIVPEGEDLYFISADKDYKSDLFENEFNSFLKTEWKERKDSNIIYYKTLVSFMNEHIKEIQLETETKKEKYIQELSESCSFVTTHGVIAMLKDLSGWTDDQIEELCSIAINNNQVGWILSDPDVHLFYKTILTQKKDGFLENSFSKEVLDIINEYENK